MSQSSLCGWPGGALQSGQFVLSFIFVPFVVSGLRNARLGILHKPFQVNQPLKSQVVEKTFADIINQALLIVAFHVDLHRPDNKPSQHWVEILLDRRLQSRML